MALVSSDQFALYRPTDASNRKTSLDDITSFIQATTASTLQEVTDNGSDTTNTILINKNDGADSALTIQAAGVQTAALLGSGSATFTGNVVAGDTSSAYSRIQPQGGVFSVRPEGSTDVIFNGGRVGEANNVTLSADGSFSFAGGTQCTIGTFDFNSTTTSGWYFNPDGNSAAQAVDGDEYRKLWQGYLADMLTSFITADGSATFDGTLQVKGTNSPPSSGKGLEVYYDAAQGLSMNAYDRDNNNYVTLGIGSTNWSIDKDGVATFDDSVLAGSGDPWNGVNVGSKLYWGGSIGACAAAGSSYTFAGFLEGTSELTAGIKADGSATFTSNLTTEGILYAGQNDNAKAPVGVAAQCNSASASDAAVTARNHVAGGNNWVGGNKDGNAITSTIKETGDATFTGTLSAGTIANTVPLDSWDDIPPLT